MRGAGTNTVTVDRPAGTADWFITAAVIKLDGSGRTLTVSILLPDGKVLSSQSTSSAFGLAEDSYTFNS